MRTLLGVVLLLTMVVFGNSPGKRGTHRDYVPDEKTAERIAEAVLVSQYGQERVNAQLPLRSESTDKDYWLVQGMLHESNQKGGNFGVWINKHSGCVLNVIEHMK